MLSNLPDPNKSLLGHAVDDVPALFFTDFAEPRSIDGRMIACILTADDEDRSEGQMTAFDYSTNWTLQVQAVDMPHRPMPVANMTIDGELYTVKHSRMVVGVLEIFLQTRSV